MKKLFITMLLIFACASCAYAFEDITVEEKPPVLTQKEYDNEDAIHPEIAFDWLEIPVNIRTQQSNKFKNIIFDNNSNIYLSKEEFNREFNKYKKDTEYKHHYMLANNGVTEDEDAKYNPFYYKKDTLVIYAIQFKNNFHNSLYYTAYGKLYYVDITSDNYPNFPYYSMQYDRKGNLRSAIYFVSNDIQYMYNPDKEFLGVWYKDKMYDINGKQISTREGW